jgi:hypothetical protein
MNEATRKAIYLHKWACKEDIVSDFEDIYITGAEYHADQAPYPNAQHWLAKKEKLKRALEDEKYQVNILLASYTYEDYSGDAFVLFEKERKLFEVNGGHCSCYGLENQWKPESTTVESLLHRLNEGTLGLATWDDKRNVFARELRQVLATLPSAPSLQPVDS